MSDYPFGFKTAVESEVFEIGLNEEVIRRISQKKNEPEFMLEFRLNAYKKFLEMAPPNWANLSFDPIDLQKISYYAA
jgi:Fe-S cluster assembly protein SufB